MSHTKVHTTYRGLVLDPFQKEALSYVDKNQSVLVAAPTGVGKTLIADYLIEKVYKEGGRVVYTAPIKALSNQKFKEFKKHMGEEAVGILTGDLVINPDAAILVMTTEIFRNLLQQSLERVVDVRYVVFDEIHYIDDPQRGSVWEESLIFMPPSMRFLGLSATIPNVEELADWIGSIQGRKVKIVKHLERVVPLRHYLYEKSLGLTTLPKLIKRHKKINAEQWDLPPWERPALPATHPRHLVGFISEEYLPCLFFTFSRRKCESNALELGREMDFLTEDQKEKTKEIMEKVTENYPTISSDRWSSLRELVDRGIGYHHAGMLPVLKDIVEELFTARLLPVLFCTETFAVGLNFPCKSVCFEGSTKWDGKVFRAMTNREYFQMSGRAGRRGIDTEGYVFTMVNLNYFNSKDFPSMQENHIEPLKSQFSLNYNSVLNLIHTYDEDDIYRILGKNFATFQATEEKKRIGERKREIKEELKKVSAQSKVAKKMNANYVKLLRQERSLDPKKRYITEFLDKKALLQALGYLEEETLTAAGLFASRIHGQELLVTEMFMEGLFHTYSPAELTGIVVAIGYEPRRNESIVKHNLSLVPVRKIIHRLRGLEDHFLGYTTVTFFDHIVALAYRWSEGETFANLVSAASIDEGDIVFAFRRGIDLLRQIRNAASEDSLLGSRMRECIALMDRDEVSIWL